MSNALRKKMYSREMSKEREKYEIMKSDFLRLLLFFVAVSAYERICLRNN